MKSQDSVSAEILISFSCQQGSEQIHIRELGEALTQIKREFEEANLTHAHELAEVREGWEKVKETHEREINEALSARHQPQVQLKVVSR